MSFSNELIVIWEDGLMENQIPMYRTQACSQANVGLVSLRKNYLGSTLGQHSNEHCCASVQHGTNVLVLRKTDEQNHIGPTSANNVRWIDIMSDELLTLDQRCIAISGYHFDTHALDVIHRVRRVVIRSLTKQKTCCA